jgi:hypothetical protein
MEPLIARKEVFYAHAIYLDERYDLFVVLPTPNPILEHHSVWKVQCNAESSVDLDLFDPVDHLSKTSLNQGLFSHHCSARL